MYSKIEDVLFVSNQPYHTKQVLEEFKKNNIYKLYIFSDFSKNRKDNAEVKRIKFFHSYSLKKKSNKKIKALLKTIILYKFSRRKKHKITKRKDESLTY